ncbi:MAG: class I SAM-dependent RNA methyltransferase [Clostridia bacterium]|nr:class I SAM-dependent RNA methyltransferase [Clostridia bacterium]
MKMELIATATFGLEAVVKREIQNLGFKILKTEDGKITYVGDERTLVKSNLWLRTADRVLIKMAEFKALEFEDLFQQTKAIGWASFIPEDGNFIVSGTSVKSKLHSVPACQSVVEKAIIEKLKETYPVDRFSKSGAIYAIKVTILKDRVTITLDTSGAGLHKRGYRVKDVKAPMKETLASALIQLSFFKPGRFLIDPCSGSGTLPIEAAMIARNIAPGLNRKFACEDWDLIDKDLWKEERKLAYEAIDYSDFTPIQAFDIDPDAVEAAKENAIEAGVDDLIIFKTMDMAKALEKIPQGVKSGIIVTNPPYGERIGEKEAIEKIYAAYNKFFKSHPTWSLFLITTDKELEEKAMGRPADRRRKLYNGRLETCYYQFHGEKTDENPNR